MAWAATLGFETLIKLLVEAGADFDLKDENNQTPLWRALAEGHEDTAKLILQALLDVKWKNAEMSMPHRDAIKLLREANAEVSQGDYDYSSLQEVVRNRYEDPVTR